MPVVPFSRSAVAGNAGPQGSRTQLREPPPEPWALMAAAQMHSEGRLVAAPDEKAKLDERPR